MKSFKKLEKVLVKIFVVMMFSVFVGNYNISIADVGSFESYDSGSSSSGWSSSSDWGSSSWDSDYSYGVYSGGGGSGIGLIFFIIVVAIVVYGKYKGKGNINKSYDNLMNMQSNQMNSFNKSEDEVEKEVKTTDELFNKDEFISWTRELFVKLQEAWSARDWSTIRVFETNELFEQHQRQLQGYIDRKQINMMERICVLSSRLADFKQTGDKDVITVILKSKMVDYIIDETTGKIIKGDKTTDRYSTYKLDFIRKTGVKTKPGSNQINTTNCPNCGAPTQITSSGKCEYCGSVVTTGEYSWALANLEKIG